MKHWRKSIVCSIWLQTTGNEPGLHDVIQACILPITHTWKMDKRSVPFFCDLQPKRVGQYETKTPRSRLRKAALDGLDPFGAVEMFETWVEEKFKGEKILPLSYNWPLTKRFLIDWMQPKTVDLYFSNSYRDPLAIANYVNDRLDYRTEPLKYNDERSFRILCTKHEIGVMAESDEFQQDCLAQSVRLLELYLAMVASIGS